MTRSGLVLLLVVLAQPAFAGPFADACVARAGVATAAKTCTCQEELAQSRLDPQEMKAMIAAVGDKKEDYIAAINAMSEAQANTFRTKLSQIGVAVDAQCAP